MTKKIREYKFPLPESVNQFARRSPLTWLILAVIMGGLLLFASNGLLPHVVTIILTLLAVLFFVYSQFAEHREELTRTQYRVGLVIAGLFFLVLASLLYFNDLPEKASLTPQQLAAPSDSVRSLPQPRDSVALVASDTVGIRSDPRPKKKQGGESKPQTIINAPNALIATQGQIGDNTVNLYQGKPLPPLRQRAIRILDKINPNIVPLLMEKGRACVMINQRNEIMLFEIQDSLQQQRILALESIGMISVGNNNKFGNCINDLAESGVLNGYLLTRLENFYDTR